MGILLNIINAMKERSKQMSPIEINARRLEDISGLGSVEGSS
jgi:hypothetical protein